MKSDECQDTSDTRFGCIFSRGSSAPGCQAPGWTLPGPGFPLLKIWEWNQTIPGTYEGLYQCRKVLYPFCSTNKPWRKWAASCPLEDAGRYSCGNVTRCSMWTVFVQLSSSGSWLLLYAQAVLLSHNFLLWQSFPHLLQIHVGLGSECSRVPHCVVNCRNTQYVFVCKLSVKL